MAAFVEFVPDMLLIDEAMVVVGSAVTAGVSAAGLYYFVSLSCHVDVCEC